MTIEEGKITDMHLVITKKDFVRKSGDKSYRSETRYEYAINMKCQSVLKICDGFIVKLIPQDNKDDAVRVVIFAPNHDKNRRSFVLKSGDSMQLYSINSDILTDYSVSLE